MKDLREIRCYSLCILILCSGLLERAKAQQKNAPGEGKLLAPAVLPGNGAQQYDFFYAGESKARNMYIVRNGKITWSYIDTTGKGEISDAVLMANGNVLFAHQFGITLINRNKKILWNYDAPDGFETHTAQPIGNDHVVFVQNGNPAKVFVINIRTNTVEKEFSLPFKSGTHGQIRHAGLTAQGTLLVAHMDLGKVCEYDIDGHQLSSIDVPSVWSAVPLKNGNILVTSNQGFVREITREGDPVWECSLKDLPGYTLNNPQLAVRLANGNTLVNNWFNQWSATLDPANPPVQAVEVTPGKKIVWALRCWTAPLNLGPSTTIQILDDPNSSTNDVHFGNIK
jgi:outer membrane protein assembly factor BamB